MFMVDYVWRSEDGRKEELWRNSFGWLRKNKIKLMFDTRNMAKQLFILSFSVLSSEKKKLLWEKMGEKL